MEELQTIAAVIAGILLRIGIPVGATFLLGSFLRKLDSRWREEAKQQVLEARLVQQRQTLLDLWLDQPCHQAKNCSEEEKESCRAAKNLGQPCWESHQINGILAKSCQDCAYREELILALEQATI